MSTQAREVAGAEAGDVEPSGTGALGFLARFLWERPSAALGLFLMLALAVVFVAAPLIAPFDPEQSNPSVALRPPGGAHLFGTDTTGMDIFSRVVHGTRSDLSIGVIGTLVAALVGVPLGVIVGFYAGTKSELVMRALDVLQAFPTLILALAIVAILRQGIGPVIFAIAFVTAPVYVRLMRAQALQLRGSPYVEAARCIGNPDWRILFLHLLPNALSPALVQSTLTCAFAIVITTSLAFIGIGITPPTPEWGSMIRIGAEQMITGQWWVAFFPGLAVAITVLAFNLLGEGFQDLLDPTQRR